MDMRLQLLETVLATAPDGTTHKVCAYERLARDPSLPGEHWESTGVIEYRLADGRLLDVGADGTARLPGSGVVLSMPARGAHVQPA